MKRVIPKKKTGIDALPWTGSNSTDFSCVHVSNSEVVRLNIEIDLLDAAGLDFFFLDDVSVSVGTSSSSSSSSSSLGSLSADRVTPATGFS